MSDWRGKAAELLPELAQELAESGDPMWFWIQVHLAFNNAYQPPQDEDLIRRIYAFADWSLQQDDGKGAMNHLPTCVCVCFYESIPTCPPARADMPRWFTRAEVEESKEIFSYFLSEQEFADLLALFPHKQIERPQQKGKRKRRKPH